MGIDKEKILGIAQRYFLKGQSKKAVKELQKLVEGSPEDSRLRLKLGDLYLKDGENESAVKEYLKVAELYEREELNLKAVSIYKKVLSINPKFIEALRKIAKLYNKEGLEGSAKNCYQAILKIRPDDAEALSALEGMAHHYPPREVSKTPGVGSLARPSSEPKIGPERPDLPPPRAFGDSSIHSEQTEGGLTSNKDAETHYHLGIAYKEMELFDYAITEFEMASEDLVIRFDCYIMLGTCYMEKGDYNRSIEYFRKA
ncbi:MAG TPA: tetratricopeptide repeat protein, partial [Thermodesulfobacteriota bacterium]|nr:tetratricopeptide repeat protein [Thermodesulfobacteriota bacterium]